MLAAMATVATSGEPVPTLLRSTAFEPVLLSLGWQNSIVFNLSIGYLVSLFFWYLVVFRPEKNRREILRSSLQRTYSDVREQIVQILIWASGESHETKFVSHLSSNAKAFREYFSENSSSRWYAALNGMQGNPERLREMAYALDTLSNEVSYVLSTTQLQDERLHDFMKVLAENIRRLRYYESGDYDQVKYIGNFVWSLLANWSLISGQRNDDIVQSMIARI